MHSTHDAPQDRLLELKERWEDVRARELAARRNQQSKPTRIQHVVSAKNLVAELELLRNLTSSRRSGSNPFGTAIDWLEMYQLIDADGIWYPNYVGGGEDSAKISYLMAADLVADMVADNASSLRMAVAEVVTKHDLPAVSFDAANKRLERVYRARSASRS